MAETLEQLQCMINELNVAGKKAGLEMNVGKTKIMTNNISKPELKIDNINIEYVDEIVYLGQKIALEEGGKKEVERRITLAWNKFWILKHILKRATLKKVLSSTAASYQLYHIEHKHGRSQKKKP